MTIDQWWASVEPGERRMVFWMDRSYNPETGKPRNILKSIEIIVGDRSERDNKRGDVHVKHQSQFGATTRGEWVEDLFDLSMLIGVE